MNAQIIYGDNSIMEADKNGGCLIVNTKPEGNYDLSIVTVKSEDGVEVYHDAKIMECASVDGRYWFAFYEQTPEEKKQEEYAEAIEMLSECILEMSEIIYS